MQSVPLWNKIRFPIYSIYMYPSLFGSNLDILAMTGEGMLTPPQLTNTRRAFAFFACHTLHWCHNDHDGVSNHQPHGCLLNRLFKRRSKKTSKLRFTGFVWGIHRDRWIPRTKGQLRGKCFHLMTSSWHWDRCGHLGNVWCHAPTVEGKHGRIWNVWVLFKYPIFGKRPVIHQVNFAAAKLRDVIYCIYLDLFMQSLLHDGTKSLLETMPTSRRWWQMTTANWWRSISFDVNCSIICMRAR